jgi:hypothetical protein
VGETETFGLFSNKTNKVCIKILTTKTSQVKSEMKKTTNEFKVTAKKNMCDAL